MQTSSGHSLSWSIAIINALHDVLEIFKNTSKWSIILQDVSTHAIATACKYTCELRIHFLRIFHVCRGPRCVAHQGAP